MIMARLSITLGFMLVLLCSGSFGDIIYTNDFGTVDQFNAMIWTSLYGAGTSQLQREGLGSGPNPPGDLDGDSYYQSVVQNAGGSWGVSAGTKCIYAPLFKTMTNITVSGYGAGHWDSYSSGVIWLVGYDGVNWSHSVSTDNNTNWHYKSVNTGSDPNYDGTDKVWVQVQVRSANNSIPSGYWGRTGALKVEADIQEGQIGDRVSIMLNDMGTAQQRDEWIMSGFMVVDDTGSGNDTDGDGKSAGLRCTAPCSAVAMMRVDAPAGLSFKNPIAIGQGYGALSAYASYAQVRLSRDGVVWDVASTMPNAPEWYTMTADATDNPNYQNAESLWVQVYMFSWHASYLPQARNIVVTAELAAGTPPYCGQDTTEYLPADINKDCYVGLSDLAAMAAQWLDCTNPADPACE